MNTQKERRPSGVGQFFKYVLATIVGVVLLTIIGFFILAGLVGAAASSGEKVSVEANSVLKLNLNTSIDERTTDVPFSFGGSNATDAVGVLDLKTALKQAKTDANIKGIYLQAEEPQGGWASLEEIRNALIDFKTSKKFIYAYAEGMTEKGYYLASVADKIYLNPAGGMEWNGLNAELSFFKGTLDKLGIKPEIFRVGEFKSAVEPFFLDKASPANRLQVSSFLNSINNQFMLNVAKSRGIRADSLRAYADQLSIDTPADALRAKLITHVGYRDQLEAELKKVLGLGEKKKVEYITLSKYEDAEKETKDEEGGSDRVAVLVASGDIVDGAGDGTNIGSVPFVKELKKLRDNDRVKAIVLRVNSGGGSALASDVMLRELQLTDAVKPVIVSMSDYAASGGYYMAIGGRKIVAEPNTLTGSIGVFSVLFNTETFFKDKLGVTYDRVMTNANADFPATTHEMSAFQKAKIQTSTNRVYAIFTQKVANARHLPVDSVRRMAGGRVWTGAQAKANGLVDMLGGLDDAVKLAATTAKLGDKYKVRYYPQKKEFFEQLAESFGNKKDEEARMLAQLGDLAPYVKYLQTLKHLQGTQMRIPFVVEIQ
jgi:protease IV